MMPSVYPNDRGFVELRAAASVTPWPGSGWLAGLAAGCRRQLAGPDVGQCDLSRGRQA